MSGIQMSENTRMTSDERKVIQTTNSTTFYGEMVRSPMTDKLLLCLLETIQELKEEVTELKKINQNTSRMLQEIMTTTYMQGTAVKVHTC